MEKTLRSKCLIRTYKKKALSLCNITFFHKFGLNIWILEISPCFLNNERHTALASCIKEQEKINYTFEVDLHYALSTLMNVYVMCMTYCIMYIVY